MAALYLGAGFLLMSGRAARESHGMASWRDAHGIRANTQTINDNSNNPASALECETAGSSSSSSNSTKQPHEPLGTPHRWWTRIRLTSDQHTRARDTLAAAHCPVVVRVSGPSQNRTAFPCSSSRTAARDPIIYGSHRVSPWRGQQHPAAAATDRFPTSMAPSYAPPPALHRRQEAPQARQAAQARPLPPRTGHGWCGRRRYTGARGGAGRAAPEDCPDRSSMRRCASAAKGLAGWRRRSPCLPPPTPQPLNTHPWSPPSPPHIYTPKNAQLDECPICFLCYPALNRSICCKSMVCTECFLQLQCSRSPAGQAACPFCKAPNLCVRVRAVW